jgi:predicted homoserine dehydrogenase-like protein
VYGKVQDEGNSKVVKVGFVWAGVLNPTLQNNVASIAGFGIGAFSVKLERLENDSTYFIWPYLTNKEGTLS